MERRPITEVQHPFLQFPPGPQEELFQVLCARPLGVGRCIDWAALEKVHLANLIWALPATTPWDQFFDIVKPTYLEFTLELGLTFKLQTGMAEYDNPGTVQLCLGGLVRQLNIPELGAALGLYTDKFMETNHFPHLHRHIHHSPSSCWVDLHPATSIYDRSSSKASA
ncbi:hypothetical protein GOBAR_AA17241 [Gossypium barbadense]|uniref:Uncharacterized protein n=1 Tax=Gossypium barbadense TaxID=3634 RepID=A0A2P5XJC1_GOSBA|nr:hypothetical protein GOBAR_AA17241 [Gossypium barbadense]